MLSAVRAVGVLLVLSLECSGRKMSRFLDDVSIVDALNEPADDSGSEGDVRGCIKKFLDFLPQTANRWH